MGRVICRYFIIFSNLEKINFDISIFFSHVVLCVHLKFFFKIEKVNLQR